VATQGIDQFLAALRSQESNNNYQARNPSGASGAYQFLDATWGNYGGYKSAADAPPSVQDARARQLAEQYFARFGNWSDVAKAWYAGPGFANKNQTVRQGSGAYPSINEYASSVVSKMGGTVQAASVNTPGTIVTARPTDKTGITALQQTMKNAGIDPGPIDGLWGPKTQAAYDKYSAQNANSPFPTMAGMSDDDKITALMFTEQGAAVAPFINDPQIRSIFLRYIHGEIDETTLTGLVRQTNTYKNTNSTQRQWDQLLATDPATANNQLDQARQGVIRYAENLGYSLTWEQATDLATQTKRNGLNEDQLKQAVIATQRFTGGGTAYETLYQINNKLASWMVDMSPEAKRQWMADMMMGRQTEATLDEFIRQTAISKFPTMGAALAANPNLTPDQFVDPYRQAAAKTLGVNPSTINFTDPKWSKSLQTFDQQSKQMRAMTLDEWTKEMRTDPQYGWRFTTNAKDAAAALVMQIGQSMGRVSF
jgi:hypothetical protein